MKYNAIRLKSDDVLAVVENLKSEFRIPINFQDVSGSDFSEAKNLIAFPSNTDDPLQHSPYCIGEIVYVKETWAKRNDTYLYRAGLIDDESNQNQESVCQIRWKPATQMPRSAARIFLEITDIRLQRLQDITLDEISREGIWIPGSLFPKDTCAARWDSALSDKKRSLYGWNMNPWVWVFRFRRCEQPEDWNAEVG